MKIKNIFFLLMAVYGFALAMDNSLTNQLQDAIDKEDDGALLALIAAKVNVNEPFKQSFIGGSRYFPPVIWALMQGNMDAVKALILAGADPNATDPEGLTLLMLITDPKMGIWLIEHGANPTIKTPQGEDMFSFSGSLKEEPGNHAWNNLVRMHKNYREKMKKYLDDNNLYKVKLP